MITGTKNTILPKALLGENDPEFERKSSVTKNETHVKAANDRKNIDATHPRKNLSASYNASETFRKLHENIISAQIVIIVT
jgi:hypothetical protein